MSYDVDAVSALSRLPIPSGAKGFADPSDGATTTGAGLAAAGATLFGGQLSFPLLTVRDSAVQHNIDQLARFTAGVGLGFAPHAKTTMAPQIFARQLAAGAWGLTAATIDQLLVYRRFGVRRVLLANELLDPAGIRRLARELRADPGFEVCCYVDSLDGVRILDDVLTSVRADVPGEIRGDVPGEVGGAVPGGDVSGDDVLGAAAVGRRLDVMVELGYPGGRTGSRSLTQAREVAAAAAATSTLAVIGVGGYEGGFGHLRTPGVLAAVRGWCGQLLELLAVLRDDGVLTGPGLVTAGGSAFPDAVAEVFGQRPAGVLALLRSGSYVTHDEGLYAELSPFTEAAGSPFALRPALELWAQVLSRPEPELALLGLGRRDVGFDQGMPIPNRVRAAADRGAQWLSAEGLRVTELNDQHAFLELPAEHPLRPGDLLGLGISHPCTTLDRWRHLVLLDDDDRVLDVVSTFF